MASPHSPSGYGLLTTPRLGERHRPQRRDGQNGPDGNDAAAGPVYCVVIFVTSAVIACFNAALGALLSATLNSRDALLPCPEAT